MQQYKEFLYDEKTNQAWGVPVDGGQNVLLSDDDILNIKEKKKGLFELAKDVISTKLPFLPKISSGLSSAAQSAQSFGESLAEGAGQGGLPTSLGVAAGAVPAAVSTGLEFAAEGIPTTVGQLGGALAAGPIIGKASALESRFFPKAADAIGRVIGPTATAAVDSFFGRSAIQKPQQESDSIASSVEGLFDYAKSKGITLTPAELTKGQRLSQAEVLLAKTPTGSYVLEGQRQKNLEAFSELIQSVKNKLGNDFEKTELTHIGQEAIRNMSKIFKSQEDELYTAVAKAAGDNAKLELPKLKAMAESIRRKESQLPQSLREQVQQPLTELQGLLSPEARVALEARSKIELPAGFKAPPIQDVVPFSTVTNIRDALSAKIAEAEAGSALIVNKDQKFLSTKKGRIYQALKSALNADINSFGEKSGNEGVSAAFKEAKKFGEISRGIFKSSTIRTLSKENSPQFIDYIFKPNNERVINSVKSAVSPDDFNKLRGGFINKIAELGSEGQGANKIFNPNKFNLVLSKYGDPTLKTIFHDSPKALAEIKEIAALGSRVGFAERVAGNPSGTSRPLAQFVSFRDLYTGVAAAIAGGGFPLTAIGLFATPGIAAKLYISPIGRRLFIEGLKPSLGAGHAKNYTMRLGAYLAAQGILKRKENVGKEK